VRVFFFPASKKSAHRTEYSCQYDPCSALPDVSFSDVTAQLLSLISLDAFDDVQPVLVTLNPGIDSACSLFNSTQLPKHFGH